MPCKLERTKLKTNRSDHLYSEKLSRQKLQIPWQSHTVTDRGKVRERDIWRKKKRERLGERVLINRRCVYNEDRCWCKHR